MESKPYVGLIVHYVSYGTPKGEYKSMCRAAVVAAVHDDDDTLDLVVLNPEGMFFNKGVKHDEFTGVGGTWHRIRGDC